MKKVIFACTHSAGRSQMAAAFFNILCESKNLEGVAAGTNPAARIHPEVVQVMYEIDIDLSKNHPQKLDTETLHDASLLVTMGCEETCPHIPGVEQLNWTLPDPKGKTRKQVIAIREEIREKVADLVAKRNWAPKSHH